MKDLNYVEEIRQKLSHKINVNQSLLNLYALIVLVKGTQATLQDVHDAWSLDKNRTFSDHYSIKHFGLLSKEVQIKDKKYLEAIHEVAQEMAIDYYIENGVSYKGRND